MFTIKSQLGFVDGWSFILTLTTSTSLCYTLQ